MDALTPPSSRSSTSPEPYKHIPSFDYPSPVLSENACMSPYPQYPAEFQLFHSHQTTEVHCHGDLLMRDNSPAYPTAWSASYSAHHSQSTRPTELDAQSFTNSASPYTPSLYYDLDATTSAPSTPSLIPYQDSSRSSISSNASDLQAQLYGQQFHAFDPFIKMEENLEWASDAILLGTGSEAYQSQFSTSLTTFPTNNFDGSFYPRPESTGWSHQIKNEMCPPEGRRQSSVSSEVIRRPCEQKSSTKAKAPRRLTSKEDANFFCKVTGCGKVFSRSYNYKAHQETHSSNREYGFPCTVSGCTQKFVRKTDLQRHHSSVHDKTRNHPCDFCDRRFARKDTLSRHMADGCSKRHAYDVGVAYPQNPTPQEQTDYQMPPSSPFSNHGIQSNVGSASEVRRSAYEEAQSPWAH